MDFNIIYEDENILVIDKPAGITVFPEEPTDEKTLIDYLLEKFPYTKDAGQAPRHGIAHRLDKDTSGIILVAKNNKTLDFLQAQFQEGKIVKKYIALIAGHLKTDKGKIETLIGRSPKDRRKQKTYLSNDPNIAGKRKALSEYRLLQRFENYDLIEVEPKSGRKHQIRAHLTHLNHPIAGDKLYGFKNQPCPDGLKRQFLHASYIKITLPNGEKKEFESDLSKDLKEILKELK